MKIIFSGDFLEEVWYSIFLNENKKKRGGGL